SIDSLCAGIYLVTVTDNIGCSVTDTATVLDDAPLPVVFTTQYSACNGTCTGEATATIAGLSGLSFNWSTGSTNAGVDSLCPGTYTVTITDSLGCISTGSTDILVQPVILNFTSSSPTCRSEERRVGKECGSRWSQGD